MVHRDRRRLADQPLEAALLGGILELAHGVVEQDRSRRLCSEVALGEDQLARARRLLPMDAARIVAAAEGAQGVEVVPPAAAAARVVARLLRLLGAAAGGGEDLGEDQHLEVDAVAHPLAEEAEGEEAGDVDEGEAVEAPAAHHHLELADALAPARQVGDEQRLGRARQGEEEEPAREDQGAAAQREAHGERTVGEHLAGRVQLGLQAAHVLARDHPGEDEHREHQRQHHVEGVVARVGGGDGHQHGEQHVPEPHRGDADALGHGPAAAQRQLHSGTGVAATTRSIALRAWSRSAVPRLRAMRWDSTGPASRCTSSGMA